MIRYCLPSHSKETTYIVPRDELEEIRVQSNTSLGIEDRRRGLANEIGGDDGVLGVRDNTLERAAGGCRLDGLLDLIIGRGFLDTDDKIDN